MFPGGGDLSGLLKQAQEMQAQYQQAQEELAEAEVEASSGGGLVTAVVSGEGDLKKVSIDPKAVDTDDLESLEDMVVAAVQAASADAKAMAEEKLGPVGDALGNLTGGMGLPGM
ncbi:YbaB/EbfC family nucleoid-associated protein [Salininema proteolyticum]|uniref:Nucleoid-associated protein ACFPET_18890 n=1 Tax=Salininema proteolyticum TaxID=1607685 RepID=A0ABV8U3B3_9ACTN